MLWYFDHVQEIWQDWCRNFFNKDKEIYYVYYKKRFLKLNATIYYTHIYCSIKKACKQKPGAVSRYIHKAC